MSSRKKKADEEHLDSNLDRKRVENPKVIVRVHEMDEHNERRLSTAVDALLAEWVRQELGRAKQT